MRNNNISMTWVKPVIWKRQPISDPLFFAKGYEIHTGVIELSNIQMTLHIKNSIN